MCRSSLDGNREIPRLASCGAPLWPASGRRGAVPDDERTWEVRLRNSSWEADEQSRATGCGVGGAKCGGRGGCEPAKHAPGAGPGKCVTGAGAHTASRTATEEGTFTSLFHHISVELLRVAFFALKRDAAPGVDGLTWQDYETSIARSRTCTPGSIGEHIGLCRLGDITYRRLMVCSARSQLPHSKTRSSRRRHARC